MTASASSSQKARLRLLQAARSKKTKFCLFTFAVLYIIGTDFNNDSVSTRALQSKELELVGEDTASQWHSEDPEQIVPESDRKADEDIRYASFGTSMTWGATLEDRETEAYIKILSQEKGTNYGIRSSGPNYPAACTHSMLGKEEYDVIVIEFFATAFQGLMELVQRLRQRFPQAIIIIARFWDPTFLVNKDGTDLRSWGRQHALGNEFIHKPEFREMFKETYEESEWKWSFLTTHKWFVDVQEAAAKELGAYILPMAWNQEAFGEDGFISLGEKHLGPDSYHLSKYGHADLARRVKALVDRVGVPKDESTMGYFSSADYCLNWFQTGIIGDGLAYSDNAVVEKMPNTEKYAMSFEGEGESYIEMTNPSEHIMTFFIAFMTTGPAPCKYPKTEATREDGTKFFLDPLATPWGANPEQKVHVSRLLKVGEVQPHKTARVTFESLEEEETERPFRLVQVVLTERAEFGKQFGAMPDSGRIMGITDV